MKKNWKLIIGVVFIIGGIGNVKTDLFVTIAGIAIGIAFVCLWYKQRKNAAKGAVHTGCEFNKEFAENHELKKEKYEAAGTRYYQENLKKLACKNPDWSKNTATLKLENKLHEKIYRYNFINKPVKLIPEPTNEHSKNAIMITVAGEKVGYVFEAETEHIKDVLENHNVKYISAFVHGGEYKVVGEESTEKLCENIGVIWTIAYV